MGRMLPIGIQDFEKLRHDGYVYVDKTSYVHRIASISTPFFLIRPRRFGKSLLVSTLKYYLAGRRDLFEGLAIEKLVGEVPGAWEGSPVFHLDFDGANYAEDRLEDVLGTQLARWERDLGLERVAVGLGDRFYDVLCAAHAQTNKRCAVLVDEYDKPLLDAMGNPAVLERNRAILKGFFSVIKKADAHLRTVFITGVTKFSKVSIFSDLNNLRDISLSAEFAGMCGITEEELVSTFGPELEAFARAKRMDGETCLSALREKYDGYCFHPDGPFVSRVLAGDESPVDLERDGDVRLNTRVYNPYSLLNALTELRLGSWWFGTGTPTFLVRRLREEAFDPRKLVDETIYATEARLSDYRIDDPDIVPLLYQAGYLTIKTHDEHADEYVLAVPNAEVEFGMLGQLIPTYAPGYGSLRGTDVLTLRRHVEAGDTDGIRRVLTALFASIPYTQGNDPFEHYFQAVIWLVFTLLGQYVRCELHTASGRIDCVVETRSCVYIFEFKRDGTTVEALDQIEERGYAAAFEADARRLYLVGCVFDSQTRQLVGWEVHARDEVLGDLPVSGLT